MARCPPQTGNPGSATAYRCNLVCSFYSCMAKYAKISSDDNLRFSVRQIIRPLRMFKIKSSAMEMCLSGIIPTICSIQVGEGE